MKYHNITKADMLNGEGLRVVLWVSGCSHACPGCQNQITWNANNGLLFDDAAKEEIFTELNHDWCAGLTLSGGDPLFPLNRGVIANLVKKIREKYPNKTIWCYTGYVWEDLMKESKKDSDLKTILENIDVLLDGRFILQEADEKIHYVGSRNQRIIDVPKTLENKKIILYIDNKNLEEE